MPQIEGGTKLVLFLDIWGPAQKPGSCILYEFEGKDFEKMQTLNSDFNVFYMSSMERILKYTN